MGTKNGDWSRFAMSGLEGQWLSWRFNFLSYESGLDVISLKLLDLPT